MKIGHLTFHASHNYGSVLQAYALSKILQKLGNEVEIINLRSQAQLDAYPVLKFRHRVLHDLFTCWLYPALSRRHREFERFITEVLPITSKEYRTFDDLKNDNLCYDAYVCGGDQIWNPICQDFNPAYYLDFLSSDDRSLRISYSPSLGRTQFDDDTCKMLGHLLKNFDYISIREKRGADLLQRLTSKKVSVVCDPVLLLEADEWHKLAKKPKMKKPYILTYFLENNHGSKDLIEYLRRSTGYEVVELNECLRDYFRFYHHVFDASPEEFVGWFMNASFVYTNSFHGTAYATIFNKPFLSAIAVDQVNAQNNNDSRKIDYLRAIGLESRLYTIGIPKIDEIITLDYAASNNLRKSFRDASLAYLSNALNEKKAR